jgi:hypothetical protein
MKRNYILVVYLVALLTSCKRPRQSESSNSWTDFRSQEGNFAAQFPQPPEDKLLDEEKDVATFKNANYKGMGKCMTLAQGLAWPVLEGYRGRQYKAHCTTEDGTELIEVMNIYLGKRHAYSMTVTWRSDDPEPVQDERKFLASIRLLDPAK